MFSKLFFQYVSFQEPREYPFSDHDNKYALKDNISIFTHVSMKRNSDQIHHHITPWKETLSFLYPVGIFQGVGRRKCLEEHRQHNTHFCLCHDAADSSTEEIGGNIYHTDFVVKQAVNVPTSTRRFPRNHKQKSAEAALAQAGEPFMWFGRHDSDPSENLQGLAPSKP